MNRRQRTQGLTDDEVQGLHMLGSPVGPNSSDPVQNLRWKTGVELPPFTRDNPAVVSLLVGLAAGELEPPAQILVSDAVAVLVYWLVFSSDRASPELKSIGWEGVYRILASLSLGALVPVPGSVAVLRLRVFLDRDSKKYQGLVHEFRWAIKKREKNQNGLAGMSSDIATRHLLLAWDQNACNFSFAAPAAATSGSVGGGGDPDDPPPVEQAQAAVPNTSQVRRAETFELQAIRLREQVDSQRRQIAELEVMAHAAVQVAVQAARQRDSKVSDAAAKLAAAESVTKDNEKKHREQLRCANGAYLARRKEMMAACALADDRVTRVQVENTELERQLTRARAALRASTKEAVAVRADLEAELQRTREGRIWARVREEETRRGRAEEESSRLQAEVERLLSVLNARSQTVSAEKVRHAPPRPTPPR
jgi:hypothetical protein